MTDLIIRRDIGGLIRKKLKSLSGRDPTTLDIKKRHFLTVLDNTVLRRDKKK